MHNNDNNTANINTVTDQVSAMCQELSQGLSLLSNTDDLLPSKNNRVKLFSSIFRILLFAV